MHRGKLLDGTEENSFVSTGCFFSDMYIQRIFYFQCLNSFWDQIWDRPRYQGFHLRFLASNSQRGESYQKWNECIQIEPHIMLDKLLRWQLQFLDENRRRLWHYQDNQYYIVLKNYHSRSRCGLEICLADLPQVGSVVGTVHVASVSMSLPVQEWGPGQVLDRVREPVPHSVAPVHVPQAAQAPHSPEITNWSVLICSQKKPLDLLSKPIELTSACC